MTKGKKSLTYADAGVDIDAGNALVDAIKPLIKSTARPGSDNSFGGFGGLFDLKAAGFCDPVLVAANDGAGTKLKIAIESGVHHSIGIDLVAMCVNDLVVQGAEPLFFLDYFATAKLDVVEATSVVSGIADGCQMAGAALIGGETAEMPGLYSGNDYDLAGFSVGAVERDQLLPRSDLEPGDIVLGLSSSGVHSNGFSLVRRIVEKEQLFWRDEAPFEPSKTVAEALLTPTRIYVKPLLAAIRSTRAIKALAHITGGGFTENIPRVLPDGLAARIDLSRLEPQPVFSWLAHCGGVGKDEMLRTFNCGIGMIIIAGAGETENVTTALEAAGEKVTRLGQLTPRSKKAVEYTGKLNLGDWSGERR